MKGMEFLQYLLENPLALKALGVIFLTLLLVPYIVIRARTKQVREIRKAYDDLIKEQTQTITNLYRDVTSLTGELAKSRGELATKMSELETKTMILEVKMKDIKVLEEKIFALTKENLLLKSKS
jgi:N-glycosylase/DNA lyase